MDSRLNAFIKRSTNYVLKSSGLRPLSPQFKQAWEDIAGPISALIFIASLLGMLMGIYLIFDAFLDAFH